VKREKQNRSSEPAENERPELSEPRRGEGESDNRDYRERLEREQNKFFIQSQRRDTNCTCNHRKQRKTARCCKGHHESSYGSKAIEQATVRVRRLMLISTIVSQ